MNKTELPIRTILIEPIVKVAHCFIEKPKQLKLVSKNVLMLVMYLRLDDKIVLGRNCCFTEESMSMVDI